MTNTEQNELDILGDLFAEFEKDVLDKHGITATPAVKLAFYCAFTKAIKLSPGMESFANLVEQNFLLKIHDVCGGKSEKRNSNNLK